MTTLAIITGNRGFFPTHLCTSGRKQILDTLAKLKINTVILPPEATPGGAVESLEDAQKYADYFKANAEKIDGILVTLPNFGDERAIANTIRWSNLNVPVLVHAFNDDPTKMTIKDRRDSFCGKMSACNNLHQYGIKYSLTTRHTIDPTDAEFESDVLRFAATCRIVRNLKNARIGAIGARPAAFNTVRYSEKLLEASGISVETVDLSEILAAARKFSDTDAPVKEKLAAIQGYTNSGNVPQLSVLKMAKLGVAIDNFTREKRLSATAIQCWTALEELYGVVPCTLMSMMSNSLMPSACETDITGLVGMYILQSASQQPAALLDWNNNFGNHPDKAVVFHCSNLPKDFFATHKMDYQEILAGSFDKDSTYGTIVGPISAGPFTYLRVSTHDTAGLIRAYLGEGRFTGETLDTFGGYGVIEVPRFQQLLHYICREGFEHHVAATKASVAAAINDALTTYLKWNVHRHA